MTKETAWLDYTNPPNGYEINEQWWRAAATQQHRWWGTLGHTGLESAWSHYKSYNDPPEMRVIGTGDLDQTFDGVRHFFLSRTGSAENAVARGEARAAAWAWYDRRRAIVLDIDEQTCSGGKHLAAWMSAALAWTDAECAEVEAYAALPFPRSIDMPAPLQRILLPQGAT